VSRINFVRDKKIAYFEELPKFSVKLMSNSPVVRVGVACVVTDPLGGEGRAGRVLVGRRKKSHGLNRLAFPGGHLEVRTMRQGGEDAVTNLRLKSWSYVLFY
jgi:hypothetical protein